MLRPLGGSALVLRRFNRFCALEAAMEDTSGPAPDDRRGSAGPGRIVAAGIGLYLVAILIARLVIAGGLAWALLGVLSLVLLIVLASRAGFVFALVAVAVVAALAWGFRLVMVSGLGWPALLLLPIV